MSHHLGIIILLFIVGALLIGAMLRQGLKRSAVPYSVALLLIGLLIGLAERWGLGGSSDSLLSQTVAAVADMDPMLILFIFLPTLIFESAFSVETHLFRRLFGQIVTLAVPGLLICTALTATLVRYALPWDWSWPVCLMFGALVSATDPVAVVALLKEMRARKRLETLIEGESLLNDGTAIVLFTLFFGMLSMNAGETLSIGSILGDFLRVVSFGFLIGLLLGWVILYWIGLVFNDPLIEISLSIAVAYLAFYIAEGVLHASGVIALVTLGILFASLGRTRISPEVGEFLHRFWIVMVHIANTLIFLLVGILIAKRVHLDEPEAWAALLMLYLGIMLIRAFSVTALTPLLRLSGMGFRRDKAIVLIWGGLRGAVALALALTAVQSDVIDPDTGDQILFLCAGIVVLTITINGGTFSRLMAWLGLDKLPPARQATVDKAEKSLRRDMEAFRKTLGEQPQLQRADWDAVENVVSRVRLPESASDGHPVASEALNMAYKRRILEAERKFYWEKFNSGTLCSQATAILVAATEDALDGEPQIYPREPVDIHRWAHQLSGWLSGHRFFRRWLGGLSDQRLRLEYDIVRGFLLAQEDNLQHLARLSPPATMVTEIDGDLRRNIARAEARIAQFQSRHPDIVRDLETVAAARRMLNQRRVLINRLASSGVLDKAQAERMVGLVEQQMAALDHGLIEN